MGTDSCGRTGDPAAEALASGIRGLGAAWLCAKRAGGVALRSIPLARAVVGIICQMPAPREAVGVEAGLHRGHGVRETVRGRTALHSTSCDGPACARVN